MKRACALAVSLSMFTAAVQAEPVLGRAVTAWPAVGRAGARVSTRDLRVGVP
jgi:hypothetical protein